MKKESMRILSIILLSVILLSLIAGIVAAQEAGEAAAPGVNEAANQEAIKEKGKSVLEILTNWWNSTSFKFSDETKTLLSKALLLILVVLIVYAVIGFLPFVPPGKDYINWLIAIIIGVLSFLFVSADNIRFILMNYEALGVILTSILPFLVLLLFSYRIRENNPAIANILNPALFIGFLLYVGSKWLTYEPSAEILPELRYVYPLTFGLTAIWLVLERKIWHYFFKRELLGDIEKFKNVEDAVLVAEIDKLKDLEKYVYHDRSLYELVKQRRDDLTKLIKSTK